MPEPTSADQRRERARERKRKSRENPKVREAENERKRETTAARATVRRQVKRIKNVKAAAWKRHAQSEPVAAIPN
jgi:hypothetical protein